MLHIIYRSYGGENRKGRPHFYSKLLALSSLVRAFESIPQGQAELIFLNDGPIPTERLELMKRSGEVVAGANLRLRGSMRQALSLPVERGWCVTDIVWFAEDDYLYLPHSLLGLLAAVDLFADAEYFGLYAQIGARQPNSDSASEGRVPRSWSDTDPVLVDGHTWRRALSTTSTFGVRVRTLMADRALMYNVMWGGGAWDHSTCLIYQGFQPYSLTDLFCLLGESKSLRRFARNSGKFLARMILNAYPTLRATAGISPRQLVAADPALITHLETGYLASGTDWNAFAAEMWAWTNERESGRSGLDNPNAAASIEI